MPRARPVFLVPRAQPAFQSLRTALDEYLGPAGSAPVDLKTIADNPDLSVPLPETAPAPTAASTAPLIDKEDMLDFLEEACEVNITHMKEEVKGLRRLFTKSKKMLTDLRATRSVTRQGSQIDTNYRVSFKRDMKMTIVKCSGLSLAVAAANNTMGVNQALSSKFLPT